MLEICLFSQKIRILNEKIRLQDHYKGRVGKTSLLVRYLKDEFDPNQPSTIPRDKNSQVPSYMEKQIELDDGIIIQLNIWDTAGQERFRAMAPIYYKNCDGALIVYDVTNMESFEKIIGNKIDLEHSRKVKNEGEILAKQNNYQHFYTSCKNKKGVDNVFYNIAQKIAKPNKNKRSVRKAKIQLQDNFASNIENDNSQKKKKKGCC
ncbi:P-loop containing nucleoside triphosphate hydrolase [Pseudocohnilembus persalinus]|uniref:p-loop containing nucleoside triphosphate hydrolase n=1 Tax=Pseudocohnilembus persalinus TaxID=266149 RepID=A0A0V0QQE8_PSEPJ|nr:P-loop containing nucleoside triphosphate hydrolase [Pseudocohnilembus persalinus]|eukprot:KRX04433.1 P-loop containing nucleoside triphosphate hydrolase [Pseudocohnilembus persalinus]